ncbi:MAG: tRNA (N6-isopentenyl adenosine(37)-C2)-methylthiotransferase MiaB [Desulfovibrionaceae bacterium]
MRFSILSFGCQMNAADSLWLAQALTSMGWVESPREEAQVYILNTCSVREKPEQKVYTALGRLQQLNPHGFAAVGGCVSQQVGDGLLERFPFVRLVFGTDQVGAAPGALARLVEHPSLKISLLDFEERYPEREPAVTAAPGRPSAFVTIMQGCDNFCAYCIVPYTRGRQKSRDPGLVLDECRRLVAGGARELFLLGQNVNSYGLDASGAGVGFAELLRRVARTPGVERVRFTTSHPKDLDDATIRAMAEEPAVCPQLHLPMQAGSDAVLRRMGRVYNRTQYLDLAAKVQQARPGVALTTDIIVGFPGETEQDFQQTLEAVEQVGFEGSFSFCYSDRPGTAATALPDKVNREIQLDRLWRLQKLQDVLTRKVLEDQVGRETVLLLEGKSRKQDSEESFWRGRDPHGRVVNLALPPGKDGSGKLVKVKITHAKNHSLTGERIGELW